MKKSIKIDIGNSLPKTEILIPEEAVVILSKNSALQNKMAKRITEAVQKIITDEVMKLKRIEEEEILATSKKDNRIYYMDL